MGTGRTAPVRRWMPLLATVLFYGLLTGFTWWERVSIQPVSVDEVFTYYQVEGKTFAGLVDSFESGVNHLPYLYFFLLWLLSQFFFLTDIVLRLPSAVFAVVTALVLHGWLSRRWGSLAACASVVGALFLSDEFRIHVAEARPYTLYLLAATLHLVATSRLVGNEERSWSRWSWHAVAAALLPSVHYTGLLYSGGLLCAALLTLSGPATRRSRSAWILGSFVAGWTAFGLVHAGQVHQVLTLGGAQWIPRPTMADALTELFSRVSVPPLVAALCLVALLVRTNRKPEKDADEAAPAVAPPDTEGRFACWACAAWLVTPAFVHLLGALDFLNMAVPRYLLPSHLAVATVSAMVLAPFVGGPALRFAGRGGFPGIAITPVVHYACVGCFVLQWAFIDSRFVATFRTSGEEWLRTKYAFVSESTLPVVTDRWETFFEYCYHHRGCGNLRLLVSPEANVERWRRFHGDLQVTSPIGMRTLPEFWFLPWQRTWMMFDVEDWCRANGCTVVEESVGAGGTAYRVARDGAGAPR